MFYSFLLSFVKIAILKIFWHNIGINKIRNILNKLSLTTVLPVVLILGGILLNVLVLHSNNQQAKAEGNLFLANLEEIVSSEADSVSAENLFNEEFELAESEEGTAGFVIVDSASLFNASNPLSTILPSRNGLLIYKVQKGDTLSKIAANFGISVNTIFWANSKLSSSLRIGQEIVILPVSGVLHQIEENETIDSIAELYGVPREKILQYNKQLARGQIAAGYNIVIPGAKPKKTLASSSVASLPSFPGYFIIPTTGWNWGQLHYYNAVDIANACGTPIYASAEGLVAREYSYGYNDGYGLYLEIEHPNGATSRYAHTQKNFVSAGDYVSQGDLIAYIGNTGKTHGPTGCHLHFEIRNAKNPFAK